MRRQLQGAVRLQPDLAAGVAVHVSDDRRGGGAGLLLRHRRHHPGGQPAAFIRYIWQINDPLSQISQLSAQVQAAFAAMGRIFGMLEEEEEVPEKDPAADISAVKGNVCFEHVQFGYDDTLLMKDVNIEVKQGQMVALVGLPAPARRP